MITNTSKKQIHPEWLMGRNPNAIEAQEAVGRLELCAGGFLPTEIHPPELRAELEAMGVTFGAPLDDDPLFAPAVLPRGWRIEPDADHPMSYWSRLLTDKGKVVATIFYKAAFYDRRADMYKPPAEGQP